MKVFIAGIIQGSKVEPDIHDQLWRRSIQHALVEHLPEAEIYDHFDEHPTSMAYKMPQIRETLADGNRRAAGCDLLVAYLPSASMGTAIEIYLAAHNGAVVLTISPMAANWVVRAHSDRIFPDIAAFEAFLAVDDVRKMLEDKRLGGKR